MRPVGAPGASSAVGALPITEADELAEVIAVLEHFEADAQAVIDDAQERAEEMHRQAHEQTRAIDDKLPDRLAIAGATTPVTDRNTATGARIEAETVSEIERINQVATGGIDDIAKQATEMLCAEIAPDQNQGATQCDRMWALAAIVPARELSMVSSDQATTGRSPRRQPNRAHPGIHGSAGLVIPTPPRKERTLP